MASLLDMLGPRRSCDRSGGRAGVPPPYTWVGRDNKLKNQRSQADTDRETVYLVQPRPTDFCCDHYICLVMPCGQCGRVMAPDDYSLYDFDRYSFNNPWKLKEG